MRNVINLFTCRFGFKSNTHLSTVRLKTKFLFPVILKWIPVFLFFAFSSDVFSQESVEPPSEVNILYRNEAAGGITVHSNGFGITFKRGWHMTGYKKQMLDIEFVSLRDPKQYKISNPNQPEAKPYFFGKLNYGYILRGGYGRQNIIFGKAERSGVEVRYNYYAGFSLGITKPLFLDIFIVDPSDPTKADLETVRYNPDDPRQQNQIDIYGPGPYFSGLDQLSIYPGGYGKFAISFEYAGWQQKVTALETGVVVDLYAKGIPLMANNRKPNIFFNFYITLLWGAKW